MKDVKPWWQSKTIIGAIATVCVSIMGIWEMDAPHEEIEKWIYACGVVVGGIWTMMSRMGAWKKIG